METFYISHTTEEEKTKNIKLWETIKEKGKHTLTEFDYDYIITTYIFNNNTYKLYYNDDIGIMSYIEKVN